MTKKNILRATGMVMIITILYRILGFVREMILASYLGTGAEADAYFVAFSIPNLIINVLALGAISSAIIPVLSKYVIKQDYDSVNSIVNSIVSVIFVGLILVALISMWGVSYILKIMAPGFDKYTMDIAIKLTLIMLPAMIFYGLYGVTKAVLNVHNHYFMPTFANVVYNMVIIIIAFFGFQRYGISAFAYAVLVAAFMQFILQTIKLKQFNYKFRFCLDYKNKELITILKLMVPIFIAMIITQINVIVDKAVASGLQTGSISALNYSNKLIQLPLGVFVGAIATTTFPSMSQYIQLKDNVSLHNLVKRSCNTLIILLLPATIGLVFFSEPIINLLFQRKAFTINDTIMTAQALIYYAMGLTFIAIGQIFTKVFHAYQNTRTPVYVGSFTLILNLILNIVLSRYIQYKGIALATSVSAMANCLLLYYILMRKHETLKINFEKSFIYKLGISLSILILLCKLLSQIFIKYMINLNIIIKAIGLLSFIVIVVSVYFGILRIFKLPEIIEVENLIISKIKRRKL